MVCCIYHIGKVHVLDVFLSCVFSVWQKLHWSHKVHNCSQCEFQTTNSTSLRRHVVAKHEYVKHSCQQCSKVFSYSHDLKRHILSKHAKPTNEICPTCKRTYKNKPSLQAHISSKKCTMLKPQKPHSRDDFWFWSHKKWTILNKIIYSFSFVALWSCVWKQQQKLCFIMRPPCFYFRWAVAWRNGFLGQECWRPRSKSLYLQALWLHHRPFNNCSPTHDQKTCSA